MLRTELEPQNFILFGFQIFRFWAYYQWVDTSAGGLLVPEGIVRPWPVASVSALTWFIIYIYYSNLQFLNNVIINKTKNLLPQPYVADFGSHV
jgi:hypothetical protein